MTKSRLERPFSDHFLVKFLKNLLILIGILAILVSVIFTYFNSHTRIELDLYEVKLDTHQSHGLDSVELSIKQASVNHQMAKLLASMPDNPFGLRILWQDQDIVGDLTLPFEGQDLPASFRADPISYQNQLGLAIKSIEIANLPLPLNQAYQEVASRLVLPQGFYFSNNQALVQIDLNEIIRLDDPNFIQVKSIDLDNKVLNLEVFFDPDFLMNQ